MRILLVEDNGRLAELVTQGLRTGGFAVDHFQTVEEADAALGTVSYDLAIFDLGLPDGDGLGLLKQARRKGQSLPVLILTARDGVGDRVQGLDAGADDYVLKPFAMAELLARVRALLRRPGDALSIELTCGALTLDTNSREIRVAQQRVSFPPRETEFLEQLLRRSGKVVAKRALEEGLYGFDDEVSTNTVEVMMSRLRKRLAQVGADVTIHTIRGVGYMLTETEVAP